jgi:hypothetical protein
MPRKRHRFLKILLFVGLVPLGGCQITAVFFVGRVAGLHISQSRHEDKGIRRGQAVRFGGQEESSSRI